jgi:hypothetical protein
MDTDIRDEIDRSFGAGPEHLEDGTLLSLGRRALWRRRASVGGAALAVVVLTGGAFAAWGDGTSTTGTEPAPAAPSTGTTPSASDVLPHRPGGIGRAPGAPVILDPDLPADWAVAAQPDGLHVSSEVKIRELWDDPWRLRDSGDWSVAIAYDGPGGVTWWAGYVAAGGAGASASILATQADGLGFRAWVLEQRTGVYGQGAGNRVPQGRADVADPSDDWPGLVDVPLVRLAGGERLEPLYGVDLLQQRAHPVLPDSWATADDSSAAAEVRLHGTRYFVLARHLAGEPAPQYIAVEAGPEAGTTLDAFLDDARQRYAEGGGGLL